LKTLLRAAVEGALLRLREAGTLASEIAPDYQIEAPKHAEHGDFATNVAMVLGKACRRAPRDVAGSLCAELSAHDLFERCVVAGPGFINFTLAPHAVFAVIGDVLSQARDFGRSRHGAGARVQVEFVSANPTGPLHIGHGRGAALGSALANLLDACGYAVEREYYVNDAGRQMDILAASVWIRYVQAFGRSWTLPAQAYRGAYIEDLARALAARDGERYLVDASAPARADEDAERELDVTIAAARAALGDESFDALRDFAGNVILEQIRADLAAFGVTFEHWVSEASLTRAGAIDAALSALAARDQVYLADGARWFRSTAYGDEKDRVVVRDNGATTYFASDIAYHYEKFKRGFTRVIDVWGADHHGYIPRVKAALAALGIDERALSVVLVQFAALVRGGEKVAMSTRAGEFVTLRELVDEVGVDAARYFYVMRRADQHLEFDLDLAKAQSNDNPVYYVQYAHARISSVLRHNGMQVAAPARDALVAALTADEERRLALLLARYPDVVASAAEQAEPHQVTTYLRELATEFHAYYNAHKVLVDDARLRAARIALIAAVRQVIANALGLLGVSAPEEM